MTAMENSYTMPLLFGACRKQGHCGLSAIGVVTVSATTVAISAVLRELAANHRITKTTSKQLKKWKTQNFHN